MNPKATQWAQGYFDRLDAMIDQLKQHDLVENVTYLRFPGASQELIDQTHEEIAEYLNDRIIDQDLDQPELTDFALNDYILAFYQISNGLHLWWNSHAIPAEGDTGMINTAAKPEAFRVANDEVFAREGWVSLLPFKGLASSVHFDLYGDPPDSRFGEELDRKGGHLTYLDFFNFYHDACIALDGTPNPAIALGDDHSAAYAIDDPCDFVIYMEYVLATFGSVINRSGRFHALDFDLNKPLRAMQEAQDYTGIEDLFGQADFPTIDQIIHVSFDENNAYDFLTLAHFKSKPQPIYDRLAAVLDIDIEEEFEEEE